MLTVYNCDKTNPRNKLYNTGRLWCCTFWKHQKYTYHIYIYINISYIYICDVPAQKKWSWRPFLVLGISTSTRLQILYNSSEFPRHAMFEEDPPNQKKRELQSHVGGVQIISLTLANSMCISCTLYTCLNTCILCDTRILKIGYQ